MAEHIDDILHMQEQCINSAIHHIYLRILRHLLWQSYKWVHTKNFTSM